MTTLSDVIASFDSLMSHADVLSAVRARTVPALGMATSGEVLAYIASVGKLSALETIAATDGHPLRDAAKATLTTLNTREGFDFAIPEVSGMLDAYVTAGVFTESDKSEILNKGIKQALEFPAATINDVLAIRDLALNVESFSNVLSVNSRRFQRVVIAVSLSADLPVPANLVLQIKNGTGHWRSSSAQGITNVQSAGTYHVVIPGDLIVTDSVQVRVLCPFAVAPMIVVEA